MSNFYVGAGGNDANSGLSWANRKLTIQAAVTLAVTPGDNVYVAPGTYHEDVDVLADGTALAPISILGDTTGANTSGTPGIVFIHGGLPAGPTRNYCINLGGRSWIVVSGFVLGENTAGGGGSGIGCTAIKAPSAGTDIVIQDCIFVWGQAFDWEWSDAFIYIEGDGQARWTIRRCVFLNGLYAVAVRSTALIATGHVVSSCLFVGSYYVISVGANGSGDSTGPSDVLVNGCTMFSVGYAAEVRCSTANTIRITVTNCVVNSQWGFYGGWDATGNTIFEDYNLRSGLGYWDWSHRTTLGANSTWDSFARSFDIAALAKQLYGVGGDPAQTVFDWPASSPLVNAAFVSGAPSLDIRGTAQLGAFKEPGAFEYDPSVDSTPAGGGVGIVVNGNDSVFGGD